MKLVLLAFLQATWTVDPAPVLKIGDINGDVTFTQVAGATRLDDGTVIVGDRVTPYPLQHFSGDGKLLKNLARKGLGPGEIEYMVRMLRCGDSLFTHDGEGARINAYSIDGTYARTFRFDGPQARSPYTSACNAARVFVHHGWETRADMKEGAFRANVPFWLSDAEGAVETVLGNFPGSDRFGNVRDGQMTGTRPMPFGREPRIAIGRERVYVGTAESFEIRVFDLAGKRVGTISKDIENPRVTDADLDRLVTNDLAISPRATEAGIRREYDALPLPEVLPAYDRILVDADDNVWVRPYPRGESATTRWHVFDASGNASAVVDVPTALEVFEIGRDYLLGRYVDDEDLVPELRVYTLRRGN